MAKDKPIVAPMLRPIPENYDIYSNYFSAVTPAGYWTSDPNYLKILNYEMVGTFKVPVVHCTYLIKSKYLDQLNYIDGTDDYEFAIFSRMARQKGIDQYICNEQDFGVLVHFHTDVTLEEEKRRVDEYFATPTSEEVFQKVYEIAAWGKDETGKGTSGPGSNPENAVEYLSFIQEFLKKHEIKSVVDLGCGDFQLGQKIDWGNIQYTGIDVARVVVEANTSKFTKPNITFVHQDGATNPLPAADLLLCKDVLQHLPNKDILAILAQLPKFRYCLITNDFYPIYNHNTDIPRGSYRTVNLVMSPFNLKGKPALNYICNGTVKQVILVENPA
jgi:2-polyprenyl-3-methyl-5-hydroxy-6-metoxy-1,4-benzoquinol methylase